MYDDPVQTAVFRAQSRVILDIAGRESCVIVGRLANFILKGRPRCLHVFVYADEAARLKRIISEYGIENNRAEALLKRSMATDEQVAEAIYSVIHCLAAE